MRDKGLRGGRRAVAGDWLRFWYEGALGLKFGGTVMRKKGFGVWWTSVEGFLGNVRRLLTMPPS